MSRGDDPSTPDTRITGPRCQCYRHYSPSPATAPPERRLPCASSTLKLALGSLFQTIVSHLRLLSPAKGNVGGHLRSLVSKRVQFIIPRARPFFSLRLRIHFPSQYNLASGVDLWTRPGGRGAETSQWGCRGCCMMDQV